MINKKNLIAIAVANALGVAFNAHAEVEIYGTVAAAIEALDNGNMDTTEVSNNHSAFGVKGSVDVGDGLKGVFLFDTFVAADNGGGDATLFGGGRDGFVGIKSDGFGTVALGYHGRPWKTSTNHVDIFGSTIADYTAVMGRIPNADPDEEINFDGGIGNAIIWFLPNMSGFSGHIQFGADEADDGTNDSGLQFNYSTQTSYLSLSYDIDGQGTGNDDITAIKLAATYTMDAFKFGAIYDSISDGPANSRDAFWISAAYTMGNNTFKLAVATAGDSDASGPDDGATYVALGMDHKYGDNLTGYIIYSQISNDDGGLYHFVQAPHTSSNGNTAAAVGKDSSVIAFGIKLDFNWKSN